MLPELQLGTSRPADSLAAGVRAGDAVACSVWKMNAVLFITVQDGILSITLAGIDMF